MEIKKEKDKNTLILTDAECNDLERILDNEERSQDEEIGNGWMKNFSPLIRSMFGKENNR